MERFESECPIISHGMVDKNESLFVTSNQSTISKLNVNVDNVNVKIMGQHSIDAFASWSFGDIHVRTKRDQEFTSVNKVFVFRCGNDMAVVAETMSSHDSIKYFWCSRQFCDGSVWTIAGANIHSSHVFQWNASS